VLTVGPHVKRAVVIGISFLFVYFSKVQNMKFAMETSFASHDISRCKGCRKIGPDARFYTVMDGNEAVARVVCMAAADGFVDTRLHAQLKG